jgi:hypothetical protein
MDKFMTRQQLAAVLGIGKKKLTDLLVENEIEIEPRKLISPKIQNELKKKCGFKTPPPDEGKPDRFGFKKG